MNDEIYYLEATNEYESGNLDDALWAKLMALLEGNTEKAKYEYIKTRAERLLAESVKGQEKVFTEPKPQQQESSRTKTSSPIDDELKRDFMSVSEFSDQKGIAEPKVIEMIREGFYVGRKVGDDWFVSREELWDGNNRPKPKVQPKPKAPDYITAKEFAASKGLDELKVIQMIRDGFYSGRLIDDAWHIESSELNQDPLNEKNEGFLERLVRGEFSLPVHYWLFGILGNMLLNFAFSGFELVSNYNGMKFILGLMIVYNFPVLLGLWRAALKYRGPSIWQGLVLVSVVFGWIGLLGNTMVFFKSL